MAEFRDGDQGGLYLIDPYELLKKALETENEDFLVSLKEMELEEEEDSI